MFQYSSDELIASKQRDMGFDLLKKMKVKSNLCYSDKIDVEFSNIKNMSYDYLNIVAKVSAACKEMIIVPCIPRNGLEYSALQDLKAGYSFFSANGKKWKDPIPYIEYSFAFNYDCPHGESYKDVFMCFFTKYRKLEDNEECILYYLKKANNLKVFL